MRYLIEASMEFSREGAYSHEEMKAQLDRFLREHFSPEAEGLEIRINVIELA